MTSPSKKRSIRGFTMVEMVVVIVISGILATVVAQLIQRPVESYQAMSRRARLVDKADSALLRLDRELRNALPNSIRISCSGRCIEFLHTQVGSRYRALPVGDILSFNPVDVDTSFEVLGPLPNSSSIQTGTLVSDCRNNQSACLVVYNTGLAGSDAYLMDNAATIVSITSGATTTLNFLNSGFNGGVTAFPYSSPEQRFYVVDTPVSYLCDLATGTIRRYQGYTISPLHSSVDSHAELTALGNPAENALLVDTINDCSFTYTAGTPTRNALIKVEMQLQEAGERITLLQQAHIVNLP